MNDHTSVLYLETAPLKDLGAEIPECGLGNLGGVRGTHVQAVGKNTRCQPCVRANHKGDENCGTDLQDMWWWHPLPCSLLQGCDEEHHLHSRHLVGSLEDHALEGVCGRGERDRGRDRLEDALVEHCWDQGHDCVEFRCQNELCVRNAELHERNRSPDREGRHNQRWQQTKPAEKVHRALGSRCRVPTFSEEIDEGTDAVNVPTLRAWQTVLEALEVLASDVAEDANAIRKELLA
jgi:hypothetical protein